MQQGPNNTTTIHDELWGDILSYLPARDMVNFRLASHATNREAIADRFWQIRSNKQLDEIRHFQKHNEVLKAKIGEQHAEMLHDLNSISEPCSTTEEFKRRENLLDNINIALIQTRIEKGNHRPLIVLSISRNDIGLPLTRIPDRLAKEVNLQHLLHLNCSDNALTSLNLSQFPSLSELLCRNNLLTSLNLSHHPKLLEVQCGINELSSLDVSKNSRLCTFTCEGNQLTSLDLSNNSVLEFLVCDDNQLESLNVSRNPELRVLSCANNQLESLDVSKNPNLSRLFCNKNLLTTLDLSKCLKIWTDFLHFDFDRIVSLNCIKSLEKEIKRLKPELASLFAEPAAKRRKLDNEENSATQNNEQSLLPQLPEEEEENSIHPSNVEEDEKKGKRKRPQ